MKKRVARLLISIFVLTLVTALFVGAAPATTLLPGLHYDINNSMARIRQSSFGGPYWEVLGEIENTGTDVLYMGSTNYDLRNEQGQIVKTGTLSTFPNILHPGEKGCFYDSIEIPSVSANSVLFYYPRWDMKRSTESRSNIPVSGIEIRDDTYGPTVLGNFTNNSGETQTWVMVSVILYGKDNVPLAIRFTNVMEDILPNASVGFEINGIYNRSLYDTLTPDMIDHYAAYAYPPQWQF